MENENYFVETKITLLKGALPEDTQWWTKNDWENHRLYVKELEDKGELFKPEEITIFHKPCHFLNSPDVPFEDKFKNFGILIPKGNGTWLERIKKIGETDTDYYDSQSGA